MLVGLLGVESASGIAERSALWVKETDGDRALKHTFSIVGADVELGCGMRPDSLLLEKWRCGIQG